MSTAESRRKKLHELRAQRLGIPASAHLGVESDLAPADLRTWPWHAAIWDRPSAHGWPYSEHDLETAQAAWDDGDRFVATRREVAAERQEREDAEQRERDADRARDDAARLAALVAELRQGYFSAPGASEAGFETALPDLLERRRIEAALGAHDDIPQVLPRRMLLH